MKSIVSIISCFLFIVSAMGQGRFKIEPVLAVHFARLPSSITFDGYSYNRLSASLFSTRSDSDGSGANRSLGFQGEIPILPKLSLRLGAAYAPKDFVGYRAGKCADCKPRTDTTKIMFKQRYIDVPVSLRYYIIAKRLIVFAEADVVVNFLFRNKTQFQDWGYASKWDVDDVEGVKVNEYMVGLSGGIGVGWKLDNRVDVMLTTTYHQVITDYSPDNDYRPNGIVASLGLAFKFGRDQLE